MKLLNFLYDIPVNYALMTIIVIKHIQLLTHQCVYQIYVCTSVVFVEETGGPEKTIDLLEVTDKLYRKML